MFCRNCRQEVNLEEICIVVTFLTSWEHPHTEVVPSWHLIYSKNGVNLDDKNANVRIIIPPAFMPTGI